MVVYLITYVLSEPEQEYDQLHDAIQSLGDTVHLLNSVWLLNYEDMEAGEIRDKLSEYVSYNDELFVTKISSGGYSWASNFTSEETDWLKENI